jgi:hypothetical protein
MLKEPFFYKNVSITPSHKKRCVIRPFVRGPYAWAMTQTQMTNN